MTAVPNPERAPIHRFAPTTPWKQVAAGALLGLLGSLEVVLAYWWYRPRLPAEVPDHFGLTGVPNGALPPDTLLAVELASVLVVSAVFTALFAFLGRSPALAPRLSHRLSRPLLLLEGMVAVFAIPTTSALLFASAAGASPMLLGGLATTIALVNLAPLAVIIGLFGVAARRRAGQNVPGPSGSPTLRFGIGGPVEMGCTSCGTRFELESIPILAPHMGWPGDASLYVRCPKCGERGWDRVLSRGRPSEPPRA